MNGIRHQFGSADRAEDVNGTFRFAIVCLAAGIMALAGCGKKSQPPAAAGSGTPERQGGADPSRGNSGVDASESAETILQRMIGAYQSADSYSDNAVVRLEYSEAGRAGHDEAPMSVHFQRPNRLRLQVYQIQAASDGRFFRARIQDDMSGNMDNQFVMREAPEKWNSSEMETDPILYSFLSAGLAGYPVQLQLLTDRRRSADLLGDKVRRERLADQPIGEMTCRRVRVHASNRSLVFWIEPKTGLLRRLVFPVQDLFPEGTGTVTRLVAEFKGATFAATEDSFQLDGPPAARQVRYFIRPPAELPSRLFNQRPEPFEFQSVIDGSALTSNSLLGKVVVIVWFRDHPACQYTMQNVNQVVDRFSTNDRVRFIAVCGDPRSVTSDQALQQLVERWNVKIPVYRDLKAFGNRSFKIDELPTLIALDPKGVVQIFEERYNSQLAQQLAVVAGRLLDGDNLARDILSQHEADQKRYQQDLAAGAPALTVRPELAAKTEAKKLRLSQQWQANQLEAPGNILVVPDQEGQPRILVFDGMNTVIQFNGRGQAVQRYSLPAGPGKAFTILRTAVDRKGRRFFAAGAVYGPQVILLNQQFETVLVYPPEDKVAAGINDFQLADLNQDGDLELLLAFDGTGGVRAVSADGTVQWSHTIGIGDASGLALQHPASHPTKLRSPGTEPRLLVTQGNNQVISLNGKGLPAGTSVVEQSVFRLFAGGDTNSPLCALTTGEQGNLALIGLNREFQSLWQRDLPRGAYHGQIQFVTSGPITGEGTDWIVATPDGTILVIRSSGVLYDSFGVGDYPTGLALGFWDDQQHLLVGKRGSVSCHRIGGPSTPRTARHP